MHQLILTFDVEDFINPNEISSLRTILELLDEHELRGLFFITGHMAEKLGDYEMVGNLLKKHEIGYHSSAHSVRPIIPEFTDVENYEQAQNISRERETSHINPFTGKPEGEGGIYRLKDLFPRKRIEAFRAPGMSWTPPHLEALAECGIKFDFSSNIAKSAPVLHGGITFYPYTFTQTWEGKSSDWSCLFLSLLRRHVSVFDLHPTQYVNQREWDSINFGSGRERTQLLRAPTRPSKEVKSYFDSFERLLEFIVGLKKARIVSVEPNLHRSTTKLIADENDVEGYYSFSMRWPRERFNYFPQFVRLHFSRFFESLLH